MPSLLFGMEKDTHYVLFSREKNMPHVFFSAAARGDLVTLKNTVIEENQNINAQTTSYDQVCAVEGSTALHIAAYHGHFEVVKWLIEQNADVHAVDRHGNTPLHTAVQVGNTKSVRCLLEHGADVTTKNDGGKTAYDVADSNNRSIRKALQGNPKKGRCCKLM